MSSFDYQGKTVIFINGSTKLGKSCIEVFAGKGANVVANFPANSASTPVTTIQIDAVFD